MIAIGQVSIPGLRHVSRPFLLPAKGLVLRRGLIFFHEWAAMLLSVGQTSECYGVLRYTLLVTYSAQFSLQLCIWEWARWHHNSKVQYHCRRSVQA